MENLPSSSELFQKASLYKRYDLNLSKNSIELLTNYFSEALLGKPDSTIDSYCPGCNEKSILDRGRVLQGAGIRSGSTLRPKNPYKEFIESGQLLIITLFCRRNPKHKQHHIFKVIEGNLIKIGQHPSYSDLLLPESEKYKKILTKLDKYDEYKESIRLYANGIGIGSYVYLRRIFESLINQAILKAKDDKNLVESDIPNRMEEKILFLKDYLPEHLVKNRKIYTILSLGIHELNESICIKHFNLIKTGVELVLDEKIALDEKNEKLQKFEDELSKVHSFYKNQKNL